MTINNKGLTDYAIAKAIEKIDGYENYVSHYHPCASPIETLFLVAFLLVGNDEGGVIFEEPPPGYFEKSGDWFFIKQQEPIHSYRADFVIGLTEFPDAQRVVVECDGHDYHERTKEQAAHDRQRDRDMQAAGYKVFRFTGSEIYRDAAKCALEVILQLFSIHNHVEESR